MPEPITPQRIHAAAEVLQVTFVPILRGHEGNDWRDAIDISEPLADLLVAQARVLADWLICHGHGEGLDRLLQLPDWRALTVLVEQIEGSHP